jgi:hypothetical protein
VLLTGVPFAADPPKTPPVAKSKESTKGTKTADSQSDAFAGDSAKAAAKADDPFAGLDNADAKSASPKKSNINPNKINLVEDCFALPKGVVLRASALTAYTQLRERRLPRVKDVVKRIEQPTSDEDKEKAARELRLLREQIRAEIAPIVAMENRTRQDDLRRLQQLELQRQQQLQRQRINIPLYHY